MLNLFRNMGILQKIMAIAVISVFLVALTLLLYILPLFERKMMEEKKIATRHVVEVAFRALEEFGERARSGSMSLEDAQNMAKRHIKGIRYQGHEYFWINDLQPRMIMHPANPELDGRDLSSHKDPLGKHIFVEFVNTTKKSGAGFVDYFWPMPGSSDPVAKVSYVKLYKPWGWIIGSGIYVDDVQKDMARLRWTVVGITFSLSVFMLALSFSAGLGITHSLHKVVASLDDVSCGERDLTRRLDVERDDESGALCRSFNRMNEKLVAIVRDIHASSVELERVNAAVLCLSRQGVETVRLQSGNALTALAAVTGIDASLKEFSRDVDGVSALNDKTAGSIQELATGSDVSMERAEHLNYYAGQVTTSLAHVALSVKTVSENVTSLYSSLVATATSVALMDSAGRQVQINAGRSAETAAQVLIDARQGKESVDATIAGIRQIHDAARITSGVIDSLSARVGNIGSILTVITDVTDQTHLLSLNASIIAAQAGVHGKGFAVVASEVKALAEKTRASTQKIDAVIRSVQSEAVQALNAMKHAEKCIQEGSSLSCQSGDALVKIVGGVESVRQQTVEIAMAMDGQAAGSRVIHDAMEQVSCLVSKSADAIREQELAVENIAGAAGNMLDLAGEALDTACRRNKAVMQIAAANKSAVSMMARIKSVCDGQNSASDSVVHVIGSIRDSADSNLNTMLDLDQSVEQLAAHIELLEKQIGRFRI